MSEQCPRFWARVDESWPFGGLRPEAPAAVQVTTAVVRKLVEQGLAGRRPLRRASVGTGDDAFVAMLVAGHVELDLFTLTDLEETVGLSLWPTREELKRATDPG